MIVTPAAAIADPALLAQAFAGDSWATWRAVLKAAYEEPRDAKELALFRRLRATATCRGYSLALSA